MVVRVGRELVVELPDACLEVCRVTILVEDRVIGGVLF